MNVCMFSDARSVHVRRIARGLASRGIRVHVCTHKLAEVPGATVEQFHIPQAGLTNPFRWRARWSRHLIGYMRRFDVVNVHFLADWGFTPEIISQGCFVATPWGSDITCPPGEGEPTQHLVDARRTMLRHASIVTAWGPRFASLVADFAGIEADRIVVLPLGVELDLFRPSSTRAASSGLCDVANRRDVIGSTERAQAKACGSDTSREDYVVGFLKGFRKVYGAVYLLRAMPEIVSALPDVRFHLVGDGPDLGLCRRLADELGVADRIRWTPRQPQEKLPQLLTGWDLSVVPSLCESFGAAALESSAMGVPVVASNVGGLPDTVLDGKTGVLVAPAQPHVLAEAVVSLLLDGPRRRTMAQTGREMVLRNYDWNTILDQWVQSYERALLALSPIPRAAMQSLDSTPERADNGWFRHPVF